MGNDVRNACDGILQRVTTDRVRVPGVVAMITDRSANIYEGTAGARVLGSDQAMTLDSVFADLLNHKADCRNCCPAVRRGGKTRP